MDLSTFKTKVDAINDELTSLKKDHLYLSENSPIDSMYTLGLISNRIIRLENQKVILHRKIFAADKTNAIKDKDYELLIQIERSVKEIVESNYLKEVLPKCRLQYNDIYDSLSKLNYSSNNPVGELAGLFYDGAHCEFMSQFRRITRQIRKKLSMIFTGYYVLDDDYFDKTFDTDDEADEWFYVGKTLWKKEG